MSIHPSTYIGAYLQILEPIGNPDLHKIIDQQLFIIPSETFDVNRTLLISNIGLQGSIDIDADYQESEVWNLDDLDIEAHKTKFENKFKKILDQIRLHYKVVKVRFGVIHYWM